MATKKVKEKSNLDLTAEVQKFLKRLSIDLKALEKVTLKAEGDKISFSTSINSFFKMSGFINPTYKEFSEEFFRLLSENNSKFYIDFSDEKFQQLKKSIKKNLIGIDSQSIRFSVEGDETEYRIPISNEDFPLEREIYENRYEIPEFKESILKFYNNEQKLLEIPKKNILGYREGSFVYETKEEENDSSIRILNSKLSYRDGDIEFSLYFKTFI